MHHLWSSQEDSGENWPWQKNTGSSDDLREQSLTVLDSDMKSLFFFCESYSTSFKGFLTTVIDIMVIWIKFAYSFQFKITDS